MERSYRLIMLMFVLSIVSTLDLIGQNVGVGVTNPQYKLDIDGRVRIRHTSGLSAGIWYNKIDNTLSTFAGMQTDTIWGLWSSNGWKFLFDTDNGKLGIGNSVTAQYPLAFQSLIGDKISLFGGDGAPDANHYGFGIQGSLMQLFTSVSAADIAFGYGRSAAFTETMRIKGNGNVGIGTNAPGYRLDIKNSTQALLKLENSTTLAVNVRSDQYFKTGNYFTGAIKTIGTSAFEARLGIFTYAAPNSADLIERVSILDNGKVGIGNTAPADLLSFGNSLGDKINFYHNNSTSKYGIGLQGALLQFYTDGSLSDLAFGYGASGSFTENVRLKGNGDVFIDHGIILSKGTYGSGNILTEASAGAKMIWYPKKAAFRAGNTDADNWSDINIGNNSTATGYWTTASGYESVALGKFTEAAGPQSFVAGLSNFSGGDVSFVIGGFNSAIGNYTLATGYHTDAVANNSTAMGSYVSTGSGEGSFIIGDKSTTTTLSNSLNDQIMMRFAGGYKLYTNSACTIGAQMTAGANSWTVISDRNRKENFSPVDGESFLNKISAFKLNSWNYKGQDPLTFRHYGPMAQEFYAAFGKDEYGSIGNDTTINQADFDGINLIAIQALESRTTQLKEENQQLKKRVLNVETENEQLKKSLAILESTSKETQMIFADRLNKLEAFLKKDNADFSGTTKIQNR